MRTKRDGLDDLFSSSTEARAAEATPDFHRSYLLTRLYIGIIGIALPVVMVVGDPLLFGVYWFRRSLSAYYYSGMRDWFVGSLCAIGVGLFTYMGTRKSNLDNWVSTIAGTFALIVALCPSKPHLGEPSTLLQSKVSVDVLAAIHASAAAAFVGLLGIICWRFGSNEGKRNDRTRRQQRGWKVTHIACALVIWLAIVGITLTLLFDWHSSHSVLVGETVAVFAFSLSWFFKGSELFGLQRPARLQQRKLGRPGTPAGRHHVAAPRRARTLG